MRALAAALAVAIAACAPVWKQHPHDEPFQHAKKPRLHRIPAEATLSDWWDKTLHSTIAPLAQTVSPARYLDWLTDGRPALDINWVIQRTSASI